MSWLPTVQTVAPASEPLTLTEAKEQCRVDGSDSDNVLNAYIKAARAFVEDYTGKRLVSQTVEMRCSSFNDLSRLPTAPVTSISSVTYIDTAGDTQTLSTDVYEAVLIGDEPLIRLKVEQSWPSVRDARDAIKVTAVVGFADPDDDELEDIKNAMRLMIGAWYDDRSVGDVPPGTVALLCNHRLY